MEELKVIMQRIKQDKDDNLHPFIDPKQNKNLVENIKRTLDKWKESRPASAEGEGEEKEASDDEDGDEEDPLKYLQTELTEEE